MILFVLQKIIRNTVNWIAQCRQNKLIQIIDIEGELSLQQSSGGNDRQDLKKWIK